jgi:peptidoglycan hydrolase-like protein with peptidoglycan-binding domain
VVVATESTEVSIETTHLSMPLGRGMAGGEVEQVQTRLDELGFFVGPIDGQYGSLTEKAVWAFEKLVMQVPRTEATGIVTDEMWQFMQQPIQIRPRRSYAAGEATERHVEIYLPEQVVAFFIDDEPVLISHMSSGTGEEWKEIVTIDPGEIGNENGTEPLERREIGVSVTPGGIFKFDRMVEGTRESALGSMWDPAYFNYGIAIHGAMNVPLTPASHGCIRVPMDVGQTFHQYIEVGDQVFVWDGIKEPEYYNNFPNRGYPQGELPIFNRVDHTYTTTTVTPTSTTPPTTLPAPTTQPRPTTPAATQPAATQAPATPPPTAPPVTVPAPTEPPATVAPTTAAAAGGFGTDG